MTTEEKKAWLKSCLQDTTKRIQIIVYIFSKSIDNPNFDETLLNELIALVPPPEG